MILCLSGAHRPRWGPSVPSALIRPERADFRLKAALAPSKMSKITADAMRYLGFQFVEHRGEGVQEFEVTLPAQFVARITDLRDPEPPFRLLGPIIPAARDKVDLRLTFPDSDTAARDASAKLVRTILAGLHQPPWKGLGIVESVTAKALWNEAAKGSG